MNRCPTALAAILILIHSVGCALPTASPAAAAVPTPAVVPVAAGVMPGGYSRLARPDDKFFYSDDEPLSEALGRLAWVAVKFDTAALTAAGVDVNLPVSVQIENATARKVVKAVLKNAAARSPDKPRLGFEVIGPDTLLITTRDAQYAKYTYARQYNVRSLMFSEFPVDDDEWARAAPDRLRDVRERMDALKTLIRETVDPVSWDAPGSKCCVTIDKGTLTITQTSDNLAECETLLAQLHEIRGNLDRFIAPACDPPPRQAPRRQAPRMVP